jgi:hypothetical protein
LFTTSPASRREHHRRGAPVTVRVIDPLTARRLGLNAGGLLVRPDGVPFSIEAESTAVA